MTIYLKDQNKVVTLNARETAPAAASPNMYGGNSNASATGNFLPAHHPIQMIKY